MGFTHMIKIIKLILGEYVFRFIIITIELCYFVSKILV